MGGDLYSMGWRARGHPWRRQVAWQESPDAAARTARGLVRSDGGGRWRVYGMRLEVLPDGQAREVKGRMIAEGVESA